MRRSNRGIPSPFGLHALREAVATASVFWHGALRQFSIRVPAYSLAASPPGVRGGVTVRSYPSF
ncbi:MAG: hypothetical protein ACRYGG_01435 [Janthinobacterium lividum]